MTMKDIKVHGADWCSDCITAKKFLDSKTVAYEYIDITDNDTAIAFLEKVNNGKRIIPTLLIDGVSYTNPGIPGLINLTK